MAEIQFATEFALEYERYLKQARLQSICCVATYVGYNGEKARR